MNFEWDPDKAAANAKQHKVLFAEAATAFGDPLSLTAYDPDHSVDEDRYLTLGTTSAGRILIESHTDREGRIRIINARKATRKERKAYEVG